MRLFLRKLLQLIPVIIIVSFLTFMLITLLPGDPTITILGPAATPQAREQLRHDLALDKPLPQQYLHWAGNALHGDLGQSYRNGLPVTTAIKQRLPVTIELVIFAQILSLLVAIPIGILGAYRAGGWFDRSSNALAFGFLSVPNFILGVVLALLFAVKWKIFPAAGYTPISQNLAENLKSFFLPALTLAIGQTAVYSRLLRTDMIATLQEDYITMAKAKGMKTRYILLRHAFRPSTLSLITIVGINVGALIGGAFVVETIFNLPGIGTLALVSIFQRDYLVVQGTVLVIALTYVFVNFAVDLLYTALDPRIRHAR